MPRIVTLYESHLGDAQIFVQGPDCGVLDAGYRVQEY
jgi:hypothetical protein